MNLRTKLTERQWANVAKKLAAGQSYAAIARTYGVDAETIRRGVKKVEALAKRVIQHAKDERELNADLERVSPVIQNMTLGYAKALLGLSEQMASAGYHAAIATNIYHEMGAALARKVNRRDPFGSEESRKAAADFVAVARMGNLAAEVPLGMIRANADAVKDIGRADQDAPEPKQIIFNTVDARADDADT